MAGESLPVLHSFKNPLTTHNISWCRMMSISEFQLQLFFPAGVADIILFDGGERSKKKY